MKKLALLILAHIVFCNFQCHKETDGPIFNVSELHAGKAGDTITLYGDLRYRDTDVRFITLNDRKVNLLTDSEDSLRFIVPEKMGDGELQLSVNDKKFYAGRFSYVYTAEVTTIAGMEAAFNYPSDITIDNQGNLYVADFYNQSIKKISTSNVVSTIEIPDSFALANPFSIDADPNTGSLYVAGKEKGFIKINKAGEIKRLPSEYENIGDVAVSPDGHIVISLSKKNQLIKADTAFRYGVVVETGEWYGRMFYNGGTLWVSDYYNHPDNTGYQIEWVRFNIGEFAFYIRAKGDKDVGWSFVTDNKGNTYFGDPYSNNIQRFNSFSGKRDTIAGNGISADIDGIGQHASFDGIRGMAVDKEGSLYVTTYNTGTHTGNKIRKVTFR